jgi:MFS-type transporter involved in bile tolerance (Atg22 family)
MNMSSQIGGLIGSLVVGYLVAHTGNYNLPFLPMAALLVLGTYLWLRIDPAEPLAAVTLYADLAAALPTHAD